MVRPGSVMVVVTAAGCSVCRAMEPALEAVAARHPGVSRVCLDVTADVEAVAALGVKGTPTLIGIVDGVERFRAVGRRTPEELDELFGSLEGDGGAGPSRAGRIDVRVRLAAGVALALVGLATGPTWPLVAVGAGVAGWGTWGATTARRG